jgi:hypothetical protein
MKANRRIAVLVFLAVLVPAVWAVVRAADKPAVEVPKSAISGSVSDANAISTWPQRKFQISIKCEIELGAPQDGINSQVYSYVTRELRSLGDVEVVEGKDSRSDYTIRTLAVELSNKGGITTGFALSVVVVRNYANSWEVECAGIAKWCKEVLESGIPLDKSVSRKMDFYAVFLAGAGKPTTEPAITRVVLHTMLVGPPDGLRSACEQLVAGFDATFLKSDRADHEEWLHKGEQLQRLINSQKESKLPSKSGPAKSTSTASEK